MARDSNLPGLGILVAKLMQKGYTDGAVRVVWHAFRQFYNASSRYSPHGDDCYGWLCREILVWLPEGNKRRLLESLFHRAFTRLMVMREDKEGTDYLLEAILGYDILHGDGSLALRLSRSRRYRHTLNSVIKDLPRFRVAEKTIGGEEYPSELPPEELEKVLALALKGG